MTANDRTPEEGKNLTERTDRELIIETVDGDHAATVTITAMGHEASPAIVDELETAILGEVGHLVRGGSGCEGPPLDDGAADG